MHDRHGRKRCSLIETFVLNAFLEKLGFDAGEAFAHFTSGGSEANATAVVLALTRHFPNYATTGLAVSEKRPVLYASEQAHDSFVKIAHMTGIGRRAVRRVRTDSALRMDVDDLRQQYAQDKKNGASPFLVVGAAGTTAGGAFDPLPLLLDFTEGTGLWMHVDAAWGGLALLLDEFRPLLSGIDKADYEEGEVLCPKLDPAKLRRRVLLFGIAHAAGRP